MSSMHSAQLMPWTSFFARRRASQPPLSAPKSHASPFSSSWSCQVAPEPISTIQKGLLALLQMKEHLLFRHHELKQYMVMHKSSFCRASSQQRPRLGCEIKHAYILWGDLWWYIAWKRIWASFTAAELSKDVAHKIVESYLLQSAVMSKSIETWHLWRLSFQHTLVLTIVPSWLWRHVENGVCQWVLYFYMTCKSNFMHAIMAL